MISKHKSTIQEHVQLAGSRYILTAIIMKRVNNLIHGAPINRSVLKEFDLGRGEISPNRLAKIAMEEFRTGKISWSHPGKPDAASIEPLDIIFQG